MLSIEMSRVQFNRGILFGVVAITICFTLALIPLPQSKAGTVLGTSGGGSETYQGNIRLKTENRKGEAVSLRARQLLTRNKAFARAYSDMIRRGLKPAFEEKGLTVLGVDLARTVSYKRTTSIRPQDITDGTYELSFFPFESDPTRWEGIVYARGPNDEQTYTVAMDTTHEDLSQTEVYYEAVYDPGGAGGTCLSGDCQILGFARTKSRYATVRASYSGAHTAISAPMGGFFKRWLGCTATTAIAGCTAAATGCLASDGGYLHCLGGWCGGIVAGGMLGCAVGLLITG
jgi:hypothetical protein